jgi:uncharacterized protein
VELPDVEPPPVEPVSELPAEAPVDVEPPPVEEVVEPLVEAPAEVAPPQVEEAVAVSAEPPAEVTPPPPPEAPVAIEPAPSSGAGDSRLWVLLAYVLSPVVPIVILLVENMKNQPDLKPHTMQALVSGAAIIVVTLFLTVIPIIGCLAPLVALVGWIAMIYWGLQAYNGKTVTIPVVTNLVQKQGWA